MLLKFKRWVRTHKGWAHSAIAIAFGIIFILGGVLVFVFETGGPTKPVDMLLVALGLPTALTLLFVAEVACFYLIEKWSEDDRELIYAETFRTAGEMAERRREVVMSESGAGLSNDVFCTSHCNLFFAPGGNSTAENERIVYTNRKFFTELAKLTLKGDKGLKLLLNYESDEAFNKEMGPRIDVYLKVCEEADTPFSLTPFEPRHLLVAWATDYFIFENHVFLTMRKTRHSNAATEYVHIQSKQLAAKYRAWLDDLYEWGDGEDNQPKIVERTKFSQKFRELVQRTQREYRTAES